MMEDNLFRRSSTNGLTTGFVPRLLPPIGRPVRRTRQSAAQFRPRQFAPRFEMLEAGQIRILDGALAGSKFELKIATTRESAGVRLQRDGVQIGMCSIQRYAPEATAVLWDIRVRDDLQGHGLASLMVRVGFLEILGTCPSPSFGLRMLQLLDPGQETTNLRNIGIGIIAHKLGFSFSQDLRRLLSPGNIARIELIPTVNGNPPGYKLLLRGYPPVLVAFLVDPETSTPLDDTHDLWQSRNPIEHFDICARLGMLVVGNGDYVLRRDGIPRMISHLATEATQAELLARRITPTA